MLEFKWGHRDSNPGPQVSPEPFNKGYARQNWAHLREVASCH